MTLTRRQILKFSAGAVFVAGTPRLALAATDSPHASVRVETGPAFGSAWRLVMANTADAVLARERIDAVVRRIDRLMSPFRVESELARFNGGGGDIVVSDATRDVLVPQHSARLVDAAPLGRRFGFGSMHISPSRPGGYYRDLRLIGNELKTVRPGLSLDLCAIAKGHALDEMVAALDGLDCLLELGGEIAARGHHPGGRPWRMGIERPGAKKLQRVIAWNDRDGRALATSGNGLQGYTLGGKRYGHVVDPRTGSPVANGAFSVSVLAPTGQLADGLATAALVLGPGQARKLLASHDASALFLMRNGSTLREVDVMGFGKGHGA